MIDAVTQDGQVSIEYAVVERAQFDLNYLIALHDCARQLKKGEQTFPSGLRIAGFQASHRVAHLERDNLSVVQGVKLFGDWHN